MKPHSNRTKRKNLCTFRGRSGEASHGKISLHSNVLSQFSCYIFWIPPPPLKTLQAAVTFGFSSGHNVGRLCCALVPIRAPDRYITSKTPDTGSRSGSSQRKEGNEEQRLLFSVDRLSASDCIPSSPSSGDEPLPFVIPSFGAFSPFFSLGGSLRTSN